ncbi:myosin-9-like isoform X2, partial [Olea europaea subsp. europaea]
MSVKKFHILLLNNLLSETRIFLAHKFSNIYRCSVFNSSTESSQCTGMTNTAHTAYPKIKPFSVDDLSKSMDRFVITDIQPPPLICENSGLSFVLPQAE